MIALIRDLNSDYWHLVQSKGCAMPFQTGTKHSGRYMHYAEDINEWPVCGLIAECCTDSYSDSIRKSDPRLI